MLAFLALLPILTALVLMVGLRMPATRAMPLAWLVAAICAMIGWKLDISYVAAISIHGAITAVGILVIIFGALIILSTLKNSGGMETIQYGMQQTIPSANKFASGLAPDPQRVRPQTPSVDFSLDIFPSNSYYTYYTRINVGSSDYAEKTNHHGR